MRQVFGGLIVPLGMAAVQPALAEEIALPAAPVVALPAAPVVAMLASSATTASTVPASVATGAFRLAPITLTGTAPTKAPIATTDLSGGFRHRFTGNMMEYYPFAGSGFHLSGGSRLYQRRNFLAETADSARGALSVTRITTQSAVTRAGFKRFNPVATAGYTMPVSSMMQIGVEAGAMMGHAFAGTPGLPRHGFGYRSDNAFHPDAIANLVFGMHF